jgi:GSH-dependent disulfide-bond oxidoreductase
MFEECGLPHNVHMVDIGRGEQVRAELSRDRAQQPHPRDRRSGRSRRRADLGVRVGGDPAISRPKTGRFGCETPRERVAVSEWLFCQMGGLGPMAGQAHHFRLYAAQKIPYAIDRHTAKVDRLFGVMNKRLESNEHLGAYSIADMACVGWTKRWKRMGQNMEEFPHLARWLNTLLACRRSPEESRSTFPVGERPTSPPARRRAESYSARRRADAARSAQVLQ